jgi:hypothetical protein
MVGQNQNISNLNQSTPLLLPKLVQKVNVVAEGGNESGRSPLQLVQEVVDRFPTKVGARETEADKDAAIKTEPSDGEIQASNESKVKEAIPSQESPANNEKSSEADKDKELISETLKPTILPSLVPLPPSITLQPLQTNLLSANSSTTTSSASANVPIMTSCPLVNCGATLTQANTINVNTSNPGLSITTMSNNGNSLILQQPTDQNRYPFFQTIQPFFLNSGGAHGSLIISPHQGQGTDQQQQFIQIDPNSQSHAGNGTDILHQTTTATMVLDPNANLLGGPKKKKKRLSKKQQQQQAQLQLQQQLILQQIHQQVQQQQQVQAAAQQQLPLIFPQSFNLGHQGFSLQPMNMNMNMNFFPQPTILTLPNLILNPADGTLFIQQPSAGPQMSSTSTSCTPTMKFSGHFPIQPNIPNLIAPKKETVLAPGSGHQQQLLSGEVIRINSGESSSDDSSRQNATPDSSTNDCQLGLIACSTPQPAPITVSLPLGSSTNLQSKKGPVKSKAVSSSTHKRILPQQKQILPKIDSTTASAENP